MERAPRRKRTRTRILSAKMRWTVRSRGGESTASFRVFPFLNTFKRLINCDTRRVVLHEDPPALFHCCFRGRYSYEVFQERQGASRETSQYRIWLSRLASPIPHRDINVGNAVLFRIKEVVRSGKLVWTRDASCPRPLDQSDVDPRHHDRLYAHRTVANNLVRLGVYKNEVRQEPYSQTRRHIVGQATLPRSISADIVISCGPVFNTLSPIHPQT
ncbi:hypothetical protein LXA43DRAFT_631524 [Ganoderma leucocontextum]|nr:hypothetical protein LXA43DRAFT_631524 [Ganoderma leucocontextum]